MSKINLLPWREELRKEKQQEFLVTLGVAAVFAAVIWGLVHFYHVQLIEYHQDRNQYLTQEIAKLDEKIKEIQRLEKEKERLLARMRAIEQLQGNRPLIVRFFDEVVKTLPEGVSLLSIDQKGKNITINGVAQSNARVSNFMRNLENSEWLKDPDLNIIQATDAAGQRISNFTLKFKQVIPTASDEEETGV
jgi:type IV pilus assembly protein PilN